MADYKRIVSYIYNYENQVKKNNVGYVRIEIRGEQCKITIHIKALSINEDKLKMYIFYRDKGKIKGVLLGEVHIKNGMGEYRLITKVDNLMNSNHSFERMGGIIVYSSITKYFATEWDDNPIVFDKLYDDAEDSVSEICSTKIESQPQLESKIEPKIEPEIEPKVEAKIEPKVEPKIEPMTTSEVEPNLEIEAQPEIESQPEREAQPTIEKEEELKASNLLKGKDNRLDEIFLRYPRMYPFEDDEITECVRIEPQDIQLLPMEMWGLANNSFLLHGYYSYRHLIFAKRRIDNVDYYILGIPGIFHSREQFIARMFGFDNFKSMKKQGKNIGEFGYWYINLDLEPLLD